MRQTAIIRGEISGIAPGGATFSSTSRGFLAQPSNIGARTRHLFVALPELNVNGVVHLSPQWQLLVGYSLLYWSNAIMAGDQIDTRLNLTQVPGPTVGQPLPRFAFSGDDYWVQGLSLGAEYRW
jgi:hypothetical protein